MTELTYSDHTAMITAMDFAAEGFWCYPDEDWQINFQSHWLNENLGITVASFEGCVFGE